MRIYLVDAFASGPFTGNPAAVCPCDHEPDADWMQSVAMEINQAETAFFWPEGDDFGLRWFTPAVEVDLCGHATLASAHVLFSTSPPREPEMVGRGAATEPAQTKPDQPGRDLRFHTRSGVLTCRRPSASSALIEMDFPSEEPRPVEEFDVSDALGVQPVWMGANRMDWFFELASADELLALRPDMAKVKALGKRGVVATARAVEGAALSAPSFHVGADGAGSSTAPHFLSRFFAPQSGINEDPVTGSAHCALGPYWAEKLGTSQVVGFQASRRGGTVMVTVRAGRVALTGQAVTTLVGELRV